jgi:hypothetical protein
LSSKTARLHGPVRAAFFFALVYCIIYTAFNKAFRMGELQEETK